MKLNMYWNNIARNAETGTGSGAADEQAQTTDPNIGGEEQAAPDYGWMPEEYRADGQPNFDTFKAHYQDLIADQARRAEAEADVPEDGKYDFNLADDFDYGVELPDGVKVDLNPEDPLFADLGALLKENNVPRSAANGFVGLLAKYEAKRAAENHAAATKEYEALGATEAARTARLQSVHRALETRLPKDQAEALAAATFSAAGVKALEAILKPRGATPPASTPQAPDTEGLSGFALLKRANEMSQP